LGAFQYSRNEVCLHTDASLLARSERSRAAWNFSLASCDGSGKQASVSYDMNRLQGVASRQTHVVTLNSIEGVDPDQVVAQMQYEHPIFTAESLSAQARLSELNGPRLAFAGAYHGWGFHEDGCRSGVEAARALGVSW
jgi:predicted NAD/FAD-binding protein